MQGCRGHYGVTGGVWGVLGWAGTLVLRDQKGYRGIRGIGELLGV